MTQIFRVELSGVDITEYTGIINISLSIDRFYNVAVVQFLGDSHINDILGKTVEVFYENELFSGFVYKTKKTGKNTHDVEIRTEGAKFLEPFSPSESTVDDANTAVELCSLYANKTGVPILYDTIDLDFGGSYERNGTILSALTTLCNTTGAEYYDNNSGIIIEPNKPIGEGADHVLASNEWFDFVSLSNSIYNAGVRSIRISTGSTTTDNIIENNQIVMEAFDDDTAHIYTIPKGEIDWSTGIKLESGIKTKEIVETFNAINEVNLFMKTSIQAINYVKINGIEVSNYNYVDGSSVVFFNTKQLGYIEVSYIGYYILGYPDYTDTPIGRLSTVEMTYLNQKLSTFWYLDIGDDVIKILGNVRVEISPDAHIRKGFKIYMYDGGVPRSYLYANGVLFNTKTDSTIQSVTKKDNVSLERVVGGGYQYVLEATDTVILITSFGNTVTEYTDEVIEDKRILTFAIFYPEVEITYSRVAKVIEIPPTVIEGKIDLAVEDINTNKFTEFDIININANDLSTILCEFDQFVPIDVPERVNQHLTFVGGTNLNYTHPTEGLKSAPVGEDGIMKIWVDVNGDYVINTEPLTGRKDSNITLTVTV